MNSSGQAEQVIAVEMEQQPAELSSPAALLAFIGSGTVGPIVMALGPRALRTNALTQRLPAYAPRTVYRHSRRLSELGLIEREETDGVPSSVLQRLSEPGRALYRILDSYAKGDDGPEGGATNGAGAWTTCALIGEMWELGWIQALAERGRSASELTAATPQLSRHQVANRTRQLQAWDLLYKSSVRGQASRYQLSDRGRRGGALILTLAHWRERHMAGTVDAGLSPPETAAALRACLPLLTLPAHLETQLSFGVAGFGKEGGDTATVSAHLHAGKVRCVKDPAAPDSWAAGTVQSWLAAIVDGKRSSLRTGGDPALLDALLAQLHDIL